MKIFYSGIGGSGVSSIAAFMAEKGHDVSGSDRLFDRVPSHKLKEKFRSLGVSIVPQDGSGINRSLDLAVFSTAVEQDTPDLLQARALSIPVMTRPRHLAEIAGMYRTIAVAGTSGKSTTSGMLAFLMERLRMAPNFIGGGRVKNFVSPLNTGSFFAGDSDLLVIEACESDGSVVNYRPVHSIITNLDFDHHPVPETAAMFERLAMNTTGAVVVNADDDHLTSCAIGSPVTFSLFRDSAYQARDVRVDGLVTLFTVKGEHFQLSQPGRHNLYNALAAIALLAEMGVPLGEISPLLPEFSGIERRFDVHLWDGQHLVVDDYAHNPHKIANLMETVQGLCGRVCFVFQPHGFGPARMLRDAYVETFSRHLRHEDHLVILPIYYAGGTAAMDISSADIAREIAASGRSAVSCSREEAISLAGNWDGYVVFGARDDSLSQVAAGFADAVRARMPVHP